MRTDAATLALNPAMNSLLEALAQQHPGKNKADIVQRAVALYNYLIQQSSTSDVILRNRFNGDEQRVDLGVGAPDQTSSSE